MKPCSFDARSKGQPWPLPLREVIRNWTALPAALLEDSLSHRFTVETCVGLIVLKISRQADQNDHPTRPQPKITPEA
jgi:hypothetical protein